MLTTLFPSSFASLTLLYEPNARRASGVRGKRGAHGSMQSPFRHPEQASQPSNEALMQAYQAGDRSAFDRLVQRLEQPLLRFLQRILQDEALAEDALIVTFFKLHHTAPQWEPRAKLTTWVWRLATREAINILRTRRLDALSSPLVEEHSDGSISGTQLSDLTSDAELRLSAHQEVEVLHTVLRRVPAIQRTVFELYYSEALDTEDIAAALEIPIGSVRAYLCMVRQKFREALELKHRIPQG